MIAEAIIAKRELKKRRISYLRSISAKKLHRQRREVALKIYSGPIPECKCCKEKIYEFLAIDHVLGGGAKHRKEMKKNGISIVNWLYKNNYPEGFQVLCHNCNMAKAFYGK